MFITNQSGKLSINHHQHSPRESSFVKHTSRAYFCLLLSSASVASINAWGTQISVLPGEAQTIPGDYAPGSFDGGNIASGGILTNFGILGNSGDLVNIGTLVNSGVLDNI